VRETQDRTARRERLYQACASQHAGCGTGLAVALTYRRDIRPRLPLADGYDAEALASASDVEALAPGGVFVARAPNAISPLGAHVRYGDFTRELMSAARVAAWKSVNVLYKVALMAETGVLRGMRHPEPDLVAHEA